MTRGKRTGFTNITVRACQKLETGRHGTGSDDPVTHHASPIDLNNVPGAHMKSLKYFVAAATLSIAPSVAHRPRTSWTRPCPQDSSRRS